VIRPKGVDLHYEVELALIIGKQVKDLEAEDEKGAFDAIESKFLSLLFQLRKAPYIDRVCDEHRHDCP
jgi:acylpyruvate hydrolase